MSAYAGSRPEPLSLPHAIVLDLGIEISWCSACRIAEKRLLLAARPACLGRVLVLCVYGPQRKPNIRLMLVLSFSGREG
jgi:hypothetical protein